MVMVAKHPTLRICRFRTFEPMAAAELKSFTHDPSFSNGDLRTASLFKYIPSSSVKALLRMSKLCNQRGDKEDPSELFPRGD